MSIWEGKCHLANYPDPAAAQHVLRHRYVIIQPNDYSSRNIYTTKDCELLPQDGTSQSRERAVVPGHVISVQTYIFNSSAASIYTQHSDISVCTSTTHSWYYHLNLDLNYDIQSLWWSAWFFHCFNSLLKLSYTCRSGLIQYLLMWTSASPSTEIGTVQRPYALSLPAWMVKRNVNTSFANEEYCLE